MDKPQWDLFICHASEDKRDVAAPLANILSERGVRVWLDDSEIRIGESIRTKIDEGLSRSLFGAVILSPSFFQKGWANAELSALFTRHVAESHVLLPIWHNLNVNDVRRVAPLLADIRATSTDAGLAIVATEIFQIIRRADGRYRPGAPAYVGRLTKKTLMSLPEGFVLASNTYLPDLSQPRVLLSLPPSSEREVLWQHIRELRLAGSTFYVFENMGEYRVHVSRRFVEAGYQ